MYTREEDQHYLFPYQLCIDISDLGTWIHCSLDFTPLSKCVYTQLIGTNDVHI